MYIPKKELILIMAIVLCFFILLLFDINNNLNVYDEAITLVGGEIVLNGGLPYKDFWTLYPPGQFYFFAAIFEVFGNSIYVARLSVVITYIGVILLLFIISRKVISGKKYFIPPILAIFWLFNFTLFGRSVPTAIFLILLSAILLIYFFERRHKVLLFASGFSIGLAVIFRHDLGWYIYGAEFWAVFFYGVATIGKQASIKQKILNGLKYSLLMFTVGALIAFLPFAIFIITNIDGTLLWESLIKIPFTVFREYRTLPFPNPLIFDESIGVFNNLYNSWYASLIWFTLLIFILTVVSLVYRVRKKEIRTDELYFWKVILVFNLGINLYSKVILTPELEPLLPSILISFILFIVLLVHIKSKNLRLILIVLISLYFSVIPIVQKVNVLNSIYINEHTILDFPKSKNIRIPATWGEDFKKTVEYIIANTSPTDRIFVGCERHDKIYINDIMIYYISDRRPATYYFELHPGIVTEKEAQLKIIDEFEHNRPELIILNKKVYAAQPNKSSQSSGVLLLDDYIHSKYNKIKTYGNFEIYK